MSVGLAALLTACGGGSCSGKRDSAAPATPAESRNDPDADVVPPDDRPVYDGDFPDPFVVFDGDRYWAYATQGSFTEIQLLSSENMRDWRLHHGGALPEPAAWAEPYSSWAPAVSETAGRWVLYYATLERTSGLHCISRAVADVPAGPFHDDSAGPIVCPRDLGGAIDPSPFADGDGTVWLLWKNDGVAVGAPSSIFAQRLTADGLDVEGDAVPLIATDQAWEAPHVEAPSMARAGDRYLLLYSGNWWNDAAYGVGAAVCDAVVGPCRKPGDGPVLSAAPRAAGPGGAEFFRRADGELWVAFHAWLGGVVGYPSRRALWLAPVGTSGEAPTVAPGGWGT